MHKILKLFEKSTIIERYEILDFKRGKKHFFIKGLIILKDKSELHFKEFVSEKKHNYSYHWQNSEGEMIIRWDNAPHHKEVKTYPYHKHIPEVKESEEVTLEEIIEYIEKQKIKEYLLKQKNKKKSERKISNKRKDSEKEKKQRKIPDKNGKKKEKTLICKTFLRRENNKYIRV